MTRIAMNPVGRMWRWIVRDFDRRTNEASVYPPRILRRIGIWTGAVAVFAAAFSIAHLFALVPRPSDVSRGLDIGFALVGIAGAIIFAGISGSALLAIRRGAQTTRPAIPPPTSAAFRSWWYRALALGLLGFGGMMAIAGNVVGGLVFVLVGLVALIPPGLRQRS